MSPIVMESSPLLVTMVIAAAFVTTACVVPPCPTSPADAASAASALEADSVVAVARVARFVPSPVVESRGYDLDVRRWLVGDGRAETFLRGDEVVDVDRGAPVLVTARWTHDGALSPGTCPALVQITEADFARWAGS